MGEWEAQVAQSTSNCSQERLDRIDLLRSLTGKIEEIRDNIQVNYTRVGAYIITMKTTFELSSDLEQVFFLFEHKNS